MNLARIFMIGTCAAGLCAATPAMATVAIGSISATLDGAPYEAQTLHARTEGTSTAEFRSFGPVTTISIQGHDPNADSILHNVLAIEISLMGDGADSPLMGTTVSYFPTGMRGAFYTSDDVEEEERIDFDTLSFGGSEGAARGSLVATLCKRDGIFSEIDLDDCIRVEGTFDTELRSSE